jgi:TPR repeat protein
MLRNISKAHHKRAEALFLEAERFEEGRHFGKAFRCLLKAAELGHSSSQLNVGNFFASGTGVRKNLRNAAYWYRAAYRSGNTSAARNLGIDKVSEGNIRSAILWFKRGIKQKDGGSFVALAKLYATRRGGKVKAIQLLKRVGKLSRSDASEHDQEQARALLSQLLKTSA